MDKIIKNIFGDLVWNLRRQQGLSLPQLAGKTGVSVATLSRMENGGNTVSRKSASKVGSYFGYVSILEFKTACLHFQATGQVKPGSIHRVPLNPWAIDKPLSFFQSVKAVLGF